MLQSFYVPLYHSRICTTFKAKNVPKMYHSDDVRDVICVAEAFSFSFALLPTRLCRLAVFLVKPTFSLCSDGAPRAWGPPAPSDGIRLSLVVDGS